MRCLSFKETANGLKAGVSPQTAKPQNDLVLCDCDCQGESKYFFMHRARASNDMATRVLSAPYLRPLDRCNERISLLKVESSCCCSRTGRSRAVTARRKIILSTAMLDGQPMAFPRSAATFRERMLATFGPNRPWCSRGKRSRSLQRRKTSRRPV